MSGYLGLLSDRADQSQDPRAAQASDRAEVIAVASRDGRRAEAGAEEQGIERAYGSYDALLQDADVEGAYISPPNGCMSSGRCAPSRRVRKHVLCEKPFSDTPCRPSRPSPTQNRKGSSCQKASCGVTTRRRRSSRK